MLRLYLRFKKCKWIENDRKKAVKLNLEPLKTMETSQQKLKIVLQVHVQAYYEHIKQLFILVTLCDRLIPHRPRRPSRICSVYSSAKSQGENGHSPEKESMTIVRIFEMLLHQR